MGSLVLMIIGLAVMVAGYVVYSKYLAHRVFKLNDAFVTPAHELKHGVDYVPTNKFILWGHHFTSVAGAAPIVGPAIAVIWAGFQHCSGSPSAPYSSPGCTISARSGPRRETRDAPSELYPPGTSVGAA